MKKIILVTFNVILILLLLAGCKARNNEGAQQPSGQETEKSPDEIIVVPSYEEFVDQEDDDPSSEQVPVQEPAQSGDNNEIKGPFAPKHYDMTAQERSEKYDACVEIANLCHDLVVGGETETMPYFPYDTTLTRSAIDIIENFLIDKGYPVANSDSEYPTYLENPEQFREFYNSMVQGQDAETSLISVAPSKEICYVTFQLLNGEKYWSTISISWDEQDELTIVGFYKEAVMDWGMTDFECFYYQIMPVNGHWIATMQLRMEPVDTELFDLDMKYIIPISYYSNNTFLVDWTSSDYGRMCFNDMFDFLYHEKYGEYFDPDGYEYDRDLRSNLIPADEFEEVILSYYDVSLNTLRELSLYQNESNTYPWQQVQGSNLEWFATIDPLVTKYRENSDGTFTLTVEANCFDERCFPLLIHEVTIRPRSDGGFSYVGNKIVYTSGHELPDSQPRIEEQRTK